MSQAPSIGRIVLYKLSVGDAMSIAAQREHTGASGNVAVAGDEYPAVVVRIFAPGEPSTCNLRVLLDGTDDYWATSRVNVDSDYAREHNRADGQSCWRWPVTVPPQSPYPLIRGSVPATPVEAHTEAYPSAVLVADGPVTIQGIPAAPAVSTSAVGPSTCG